MKKNPMRISIKLIALVYPLTLPMIGAIVLGTVGHLIALSIPTIGALSLLGMFDFKTIIFLVFALALLRGVFRYGEQYLNHFIAFKLLAILRDKVFAALRVLSPAKLEGKDKGDLISIITSDIELLEVFYAHTISPIAIATLVAITITSLLGSIHYSLAILALCAYITIGCLIPVFISKYHYDVSYRELSGDLSTFVLDSLRGIFESMQFKGTQKRLDALLEKSAALSDEEERMKKRKAFSSALTQCLIIIFDVSMLFLATTLYMNEAITFTQLLFSVVVLMSSFGSFISLSDLGMGLQNTFAAGNRVLSLLEEAPLVEDVYNGKEPQFEGVSVDNVSFSYDTDLILKDVDVSIEKGSIVGIMGKSGSGKSTLLKLLMRFWSVDSGVISISDESVESITTKHLRSLESLVSQDTYLFNDSIKNNLLIAKQNANMDEIVAACKKAKIHDLIMELESQYDSNIGELGDYLSAGERQRLGLARAFLHDAPLLLLDEPTSNLDSLNEAMVLAAIKEDASKRTTVLVSHRESTLKIVDTIYKMDQRRDS